MFKVHREQLTTTSERKSGFNSGEDEFDLDEIARSNKFSQKFSKGKDFRSTDEGAYIFILFIENVLQHVVLLII